MKKKWNWLPSGVLLGLAFLIAVWVIKPIGVSTQFVILNGIVWNALDGDLIKEDSAAKAKHASTNAYFNKGGGKYAKHIVNPLNYSFVLVFSMLLGGIISNKLLKNKITSKEKQMPKVWEESFGNAINKRYFYVFISGILVLFGARLAGGCASGHMISGSLQTSLSGYLFAASTFLAAIPVAILTFKKSK